MQSMKPRNHPRSTQSYYFKQNIYRTVLLQLLLPTSIDFATFSSKWINFITDMYI